MFTVLFLVTSPNWFPSTHHLFFCLGQEMVFKMVAWGIGRVNQSSWVFPMPREGIHVIKICLLFLLIYLLLQGNLSQWPRRITRKLHQNHSVDYVNKANYKNCILVDSGKLHTKFLLWKAILIYSNLLVTEKFKGTRKSKYASSFQRRHDRWL